MFPLQLSLPLLLFLVTFPLLLDTLVLVQLPINLNPTPTPMLLTTPLMDHNLMLQRPLMVQETSKETTMLPFLMVESNTSPTQLMMLMDILPMSLMMEQLPLELVLALELLEP